MRAARTAAGGALGRFVALLHLEGVAAAAGTGDVRVVDREAGLQALDPVDLGAGQVRRAERVDDHRDAVARELVVAVLVNPGKAGLFTVEERIELLRDAVAELPNVTVDSFQGLLVDY